MSWAPNKPDIETLTLEALNLLKLEMDELYTVLGCQLLASALPSRTAGIMTRVRELRKRNKPRRRSGSPSSEAATNDEWINGVEEICHDLRGDGARFIETMAQQFKTALCNKDIFDLANDVDKSKMQILIMVMSAILKLPRQFESISATLAAMFCKTLRNEICQ